MSAHPDEAVLAELAQGMLESGARSTLEAHLETCRECRELMASLLRALGPEGEQEPRKGQVIGRFVVLEPIGAGALGEVFSAWDSVLERAVALKRLHPSLFDVDGQGLKDKLLAEARALAKVQHPNVVGLFDVIPFGDTLVIVMELVPHAKTLRQVSAQLPWREVAQRYVEAGRGLLAAHAAGVIHRDFKPENVLLGDGRVRVCDFGLSRSGAPPAVLEGEGRRSSVSGTPAYLAPERWKGAPASAATDAWALATSLYEGLAGALPFTQREATARLQEIERGPAPLPAARQVPGALEAALRRALAADPAARFPSLADFLDALERTLAPRRAPTGLLLLGVGGALVLGALTLAGLQWRARCDDAATPVSAVWNAQRAAAVREAFLKTRHPAAEAVAAKVTAGLDALAAQLGGVRQQACQATAFHGDSDALLLARNVCVARRLADLDALARSLERAEGRTVERAPQAVESLGQGAECFDATVLGALQPAPASRKQELDEATRQVAELKALRLTGRTKESVAAAPQAVEAARASSWKPVLADAESEWALGLERLGQFDEARTHDQQSLATALEAGDFARAYSASVELAFLEGYDVKKPEVGLAWLVVARALLEPAHLTGAREALRADNVEATLLSNTGRRDEAIARWKRMVDALAGTPSIHLARTLSNYGSALREAGKAGEGLPYLVQSEQMLESLLGPVHPDLAAATNNLGSGLSDLGRFDEARPWFEKSLAVREQLFGPDALPLASTLYNLGELGRITGDPGAALRFYGRMRGILEKAKGPDDADVWDAKLSEAQALHQLHREKETVALLTQVLPKLVELGAPADRLDEARKLLAEARR